MDANRRLAQLLGWTNFENVGGAWLGTPPASEPQCRGQAKVPDWTGDWNACGPLMAQHIRRMKLWPHRGVVGTSSVGDDMMRDRSGEGDDASVRRLIVEAAIAELEARL